jgi:hypothetical protein
VAEPQQPVQARDDDGDLLWVHGCGRVSFGDDPSRTDSYHSCDNGPWRPLLVATDAAPDGDRTPQRCTAGSEYDTRCRYAVQDERHEADDDDRLRHEDTAGHIWLSLRDLSPLAAQSDPMVLHLQEVPEGTVALVGVAAPHRRYEPIELPYEEPAWRRADDGAMYPGVGGVLDAEHSKGVTAELAPVAQADTRPPCQACGRYRREPRRPYCAGCALLFRQTPGRHDSPCFETCFELIPAS